jgi:pantoate--beta-alanine ligase
VLTDLLSAHPAPENFHILPTTRDPRTNLALSSRNAYLSPEELEVSPTLFKALSSAQSLFDSRKDSTTGEDLVAAATQTILDLQDSLGIDDTPTRVDVRLDYIEVFDKYTFEPVRGPIPKRKELVIAGAMWVGKTRLIDNLLLGWKVD